MSKITISFIIPALNEEEHIGRAIDSIKENVNGNYSYEIIVVDNGSNDQTVDIAQAKGAICIHSPGSSISAMRNLGAFTAKAEILIFLDADVYLRQGWGRRIGLVIEKLKHQENIITGSICGISEEASWIERIWYAPRTKLQEVRYINSGHLIIKKKLFSELGGFEALLETGEDYELCFRARGIGASIVNDPELVVVHSGYPKSVKSFFVRERWHGRGDYASFKRLITSKPALVSLANFGITTLCALGVVFCQELWYLFVCGYILFLAGMSIAATIYRHPDKVNCFFWGAVFLYMVYFSARTASLWDIIHQHIAKRKYGSYRCTI